VLIHGIGHRWQAWLPIMEELAAHHEVIALDLPGFGASPVPRPRHEFIAYLLAQPVA
jgi:pimeloyl-ACP methyl ester carboxylesterase